LVPNFNPPLLEDATQRAQNWAHTEGVKKKDEEKKKKASKAKRKEDREKRRKM
jgi:hypothetical protein